MGNELSIPNSSQELFREVVKTVPVKEIYAGTVHCVASGIAGVSVREPQPTSHYEDKCRQSGVAPYTFDELHFDMHRGVFLLTSRIKTDTAVRSDFKKRARLTLEGRLQGKRTQEIDVDLSHVKKGQDLRELRTFLLDSLIAADYDIESAYLSLSIGGGLNQTELHCFSFGGRTRVPGVYLNMHPEAFGEEVRVLRDWFTDLQGKYGK